jgi:hypothetical protein
MAVKIDTVYQRVLALANKEQRGYITPQEFNLFANQAQLEIFEQYFYDKNKTDSIPSNNTTHSNASDMLEEKLQIFDHTDGQGIIQGYQSGGSNNKFLPDYVYRVHRLEYNNVEAELMSTKEFNDARYGGPLTKPSVTRPIANIRDNQMRCAVGLGENNFVRPTGVFYFKAPATVNWGYFVVGKTALYNVDTSVDFEVHAAEETELVYKILKFAGLSMKRDDIAKGGQGLESLQVQQEKQ